MTRTIEMNPATSPTNRSLIQIVKSTGLDDDLAIFAPARRPAPPAKDEKMARRKGYTLDNTDYDRLHLEANYRDGNGWVKVDSRRAMMFLRETYRDFDKDVLPVMQTGQQVTTMFAEYRIAEA